MIIFNSQTRSGVLAIRKITFANASPPVYFADDPPQLRQTIGCSNHPDLV
jgi:hypothetical protein